MTEITLSRPLWSTAQCGKALGISIATLERWRTQGGPDPLPFKKLGAGKRAPVRYDPDEVRAWLSRRTAFNTSQQSR